jgi:hypothetical protein
LASPVLHLFFQQQPGFKTLSCALSQFDETAQQRESEFDHISDHPQHVPWVWCEAAALSIISLLLWQNAIHLCHFL